MQDLKARTIRGGMARICAQGADFAFRLGSVMVLARLLDPKDFGLLGMVTAFTGILNLFRDFGLSAASVQRASITEEQTSTLFWINVLAGALLMGIALLCAPLVGAFYHEPRLFLVTCVVAVSFLFNGAGVQHSALLQRQMRFTALAVIQVSALAVGAGIAIAAAKAGYGYWALVVMTVTIPLLTTAGCWWASGWMPGRPRRGVGIRSLMRFGGALTANGLVMYAAFNLDKVLLGRFWGAEVLGIYGRAYQLVRIPSDNMNTAIGEVAFSALSRVQDDKMRLKRYFLKGYSLALSLTVPITVACALFAGDIILVLLGPKWVSAAPIFRLLAPTILVLAIANPLVWLLNSMGMVGRGLKIAVVSAPAIMASYFVGLPAGPKGVALSFSTVMMLWVIPLIAWAVHGTMISFWEIVATVIRPLASAAVAAAFTMAVRLLYRELLSPLPRLTVDTAILLASYFAVLLFAGGQKSLFLDLLRGSKQSAVVKEETLASA